MSCKALPPADFAIHAPRESSKALMERYRRGTMMIAHWRRVTGIPAVHCGPPPRPIPSDFAQIALNRTLVATALYYGVSRQITSRWARESGHKWQGAIAWAADRGPVAKPLDLRTMDDAARAADYLRRDCPVIRCNEAGKYEEQGDHYRIGRAVLTHPEIIARAERKGWQSDEWRRLG